MRENFEGGSKIESGLTIQKLKEFREGLLTVDPLEMHRLTKEERSQLKEDIGEALNGIDGAIRALEEDNFLPPEYEELSGTVEKLLQRIEEGI